MSTRNRTRDLAPIPGPGSPADWSALTGALQTWGEQLRRFTDLVQPDSALTVGPGSMNRGVTLGGNTLEQIESSFINLQSFNSGSGALSFGAFYTGVQWIATNTAALIISGGSSLTYYINTGLTPGTAFTPTLAGALGSRNLTLDQIVFPAAQNASANANTLDDYEEGTWTPTDASGAGLGFTVAEGNYVKIGQLVSVSGIVQYPVTANGANVSIGGLPFTALTTTNLNYSIAVGFSNNAVGPLMGIVVNNTTTVFLYIQATTARATNAQLSASTTDFACSYRASA